MRLSVIVLSKSPLINSKLIKSLSFADEILVIYSEVSKKTKSKGKIHYQYHQFINFSDQRNFGLKIAKGDWVFFVDTDEIVSKQLANEIIQTITNTPFYGFFVKRLDTVFHQVLLHGETGHIQILRLAKRNSGQFNRDVHETWQVDKPIGQLVNPLYHQKDYFISEFLDRISLYAPMDAVNLAKEGKPFSYFRFLTYPKAKFIYNYFLRKGFLDGLPGLFQAYLMSIQSLSVRVFQWEKRNS